MLSGEQIGAHSVRSVTGASNVRRFNLWRNKATEARRAVQPVRYRLAWAVDSGNPIGAARDSLLRRTSSLLQRMSSLFTSNKFAVWLEQGIGVRCAEMAEQIDTRSRQARQKKRNSLLISLLSGNPGIATRSRLAALRLRTAAA